MISKKVNYDNFKRNILIYILLGLFIVGLLYFGFGNKDLIGITGKTHLSCVNRCPGAGATECTADGQIKYCGNYDLDPCLEWTVKSCFGGRVCSGGQCILSECTENDQGFKIYVASTTKTSSLQRTDLCLNNNEVYEYYCKEGKIEAERVTCSNGCRQMSSGGACITSCTNECSSLNRRECTPDGKVAICGQHDSDNCLELDTGTSCPQGTFCQQGQCVVQSCVPHNYVKCVNSRLHWHNSCNSREEIYNTQLNCRN